MSPKWMHIAIDEIGEKEVAGSGNNPRIIEYHSATTLKSMADEIPWCAAFVSWCLEKAGIQSTKSAWAKSYLNWGEPLSVPKFGAVAVFSREGNKGHVGFYVGQNDDAVFVLGGNQLQSVCVHSYPKGRLLGYRWYK